MTVMAETRTYVKRVRSDRSALWRSKKPLLTRLDVEITERCNNNCIHCYIRRPARDPEALRGELPAAEIKDILREAASLGCLSVRLTGGEPLLRDDFEEIYVHARKLGMAVILFTNAALLTVRLADLLTKIPPLKKVEISLYGMKKSSYEEVSRVKGSFEAAWNGVRLLQERKVPFVVKGAVLPSTRAEVAEFDSWAATVPWMTKPPAYAMFFDLHLREAGKSAALKRLRLPPEEGIRVLARDKIRFRREILDFCSRLGGFPGDRLLACGAGAGSGCVDAYGRFFPCMMLRHPDAAYDLKKGTLEDALRRVFPALRERRAEDADYLERCAVCFLKSLCQQCPAKSWLEYGTLDRPVGYFCEITHAMAREAGLISAGEKSWEIRDWRDRLKAGKAGSPVSGTRRSERKDGDSIEKNA